MFHQGLMSRHSRSPGIFEFSAAILAKGFALAIETVQLLHGFQIPVNLTQTTPTVFSVVDCDRFSKNFW